MTNEQIERLLDALEGIGEALQAIRYDLNADKPNSSISHLIDAVHRIDASGVEMSLDTTIKTQLERIADRIA